MFGLFSYPILATFRLNSNLAKLFPKLPPTQKNISWFLFLFSRFFDVQGPVPDCQSSFYILLLRVISLFCFPQAAVIFLF